MSIGLANRLIGWTRSSDSPLTLRQWLVGFGLGQALGWTVALSVASGWPVWQQALAATELSFLSLTLVSWTLRRLGIGSSSIEGPTQKSKTARAKRAV
jgi:hypothetical protein